MAIHYDLLTKLCNAARWLFGFYETTAAPVTPLVDETKVGSLEQSSKIYEFDRYQEYERYQIEIQRIKDSLAKIHKIRG